MRIAIHTLGTRGDFQPYLALALGLKAAGHEVLLAAPQQFEQFVAEMSVDFAPLPGEFLALMDDPQAQAAMAGGGGGFAAGFRLLDKFRPVMRDLFDAEWRAAQAFEPNVMIYHPKALGAPHIAERLGIPALLASPLPGFTPTAQFPSPLLPFSSLGPLNRVSHSLMLRGGEGLFGKSLRRWRAQALGLPEKGRPQPVATLYAYSPTVLPKPADWGSNICVSGYWFLDEAPDWQPPADLAAFLAAGPPPVYVGFGSMPGLDAEGFTATVRAAVDQTGVRAIIATGGGALAPGEAAANVHVIKGAPHHKLFPLVAAVVHHGGAGTTAAALRAGKQSIICPFFGDQPFWGRLVARLGAGTAPIERAKLSPENLASAIAEAVGNSAMAARAAELGTRIRAEHGVATAIAFIEAQATRTKAA